MKKILWVFGIGLISVFLLNAWVVMTTYHKVHKSMATLEHRDAALVLGTSTKMQDGSPNPYFKERINSAASLYANKKVNYLIVSGDNRSKYYNEPKEMQKALLKLGVPENRIVLDTAGIKTYWSIDRCKNVFGQDKITVVTQPFHSFRAIYISNALGVDAQAYATDSIPFRQSFPVICREFLARPKAIYDIYFGIN